MSWRKAASIVAVVGVLAALVVVSASAGTLPPRLYPHVFYPTKSDVSQPISSMTIPPAQPRAPMEREQFAGKSIPPMTPVVDSVVQHFMGSAAMPSPLVSVLGMSNADNGTLLGTLITPADTTGAVGGSSPASNVYLQWVNMVWSVYDKTTGTKLHGPYPGNIFWNGFGGPCETENDGDIIILYDKLADRWFAAQFAVFQSAPWYQCVAVSTSPDPTGSYYRYAINTGSKLGDYPKYSIWADAYYGSFNNFANGTTWAGSNFMALQRSKMLTGDPTAAMIVFQMGTNYGSDLPVDFDGTAPGAGTPGIFAEVDKQSWIPGLTADSALLWYFTPDWTNPANSCVGLSCTGEPNEIVPVATFTAPLCGGSRSCIPQMGGEALDSISDRLMYRAQGRDLADHQSILLNHTVDAGGGIAGVRWYELRSAGGWNNWSVYQQGTYSPDSDYRWMGSVAMDHSGDIGLGYSVSSASMRTAIRYAGRLPGDPLGTLPQTEGEIVASTGSTNTGYNRWGDYSTMQIDPVDDCTFWYTTMYDDGTDNTGTYPGWMWNTRIGSFKFPGCSIGPTGTLTGTVTSSAGGAGIPGALVTAGASSTLTNASGVYTFTLPVNTYNMTVTKLGYTTGSANNVPVTDGGTTTQDFVLDPTGSATVDGFVTAAGHGWPLWAKVDVTLTGSPVATLYTSPWNGYYEVVLPQGYVYDFTVTPMYTGYLPETRPVSVTPADQIQNFTLNPASGNPTYSCYLDGGINEHFEGDFPPAGWTVKNNGTIANNVWKRNDAWGRANETGGTGYCADADSDKAGSGSGNFDTELWSPMVKMPATPRQITFASAFKRIADTGTFDISTNGGSTWTTLGSFSANEVANKTYDLTAYAGMNVVFRWHYMSNGSWQYYWEVDDVRTETIPPPPPPPTQLWSQNWDGVTAPALPAGWATQVVVAGSYATPTWTNVTAGTHPTMAPDTPPNMMEFNSYDNSGGQVLLYTTAGTDLSAGTGILRFRIYHDTGYTSNDRVQVQASTDGGTTWQNMGTAVPRYNGTTGWADAEVNFAGLTGPTTDVRIGLLGISAYGNNTHLDATSLWIGVVPIPVPDNPTLSCVPIEGSMVAGFVTDENTAAPIIGATVAETNGPTVTTFDTPVDSGIPGGFYYLFSPKLGTAPDGPSQHTFTASMAGYGDVVKNAILVPNTINRLDFSLPAPALSLSPSPLVLESRMYPDSTPADDAQRTFSIVNSGGLAAHVKMHFSQLPNTYVPQLPRDPAGPSRIGGGLQNKLVYSLKGIPVNGPVHPPAAPLAAGAVIQHWPTGLTGPWGMGYAMDSDHAWVSSISLAGGDNYDHEYTRDGTATGGRIDTSAWNINGYAADMAFNKNTGMLWQMNVNIGTQYIEELNPNTMTSTGNVITVNGLSSWYTGLAYDPDSDTFFIGGWTNTMIYRFDSSGTILQSFNSGLSVAGLAYNPSTGHLFVMTNASPNLVWVLDANNGYATVGSFSIAGFSDYAGAGLEFDCNGHLWAVNQGDKNAYEVDSGETYPCNPNLPWVTITPTEGDAPAHDSLGETVDFYPAGANHFGLWRATLGFQSNTPTPLPNAPVYFTKAFWDVPEGYWADAYIHGLAGVQLTVGIGGGNYGPTLGVTRAQMAVFLVRTMHGPAFRPPSAVGIFADVDLTDYDWAADWIEQLYHDGVTNGCGTNGNGQPLYCPARVTNRAEMAAFICRAKGWAPYINPTPTYADVPSSFWAYGYIEKITQEGVTTGCGVNGNGDPIYCPYDDMLRDSMAKFMVLAWNIPYYEHPADM